MLSPYGRHNRSEARQGLVEDKENAEPAKAGGIKRCPIWRQRFMPPYRLRSGLLYFLCITRGSAATRLRPFATIIPPSGLKIPRAFSPTNSHLVLSLSSKKIAEVINNAKRSSSFIMRAVRAEFFIRHSKTVIFRKHSTKRLATAL